MIADDEFVPIRRAASLVKETVKGGRELTSSTEIILWVRRNIAKYQQGWYFTKLAEAIATTSDLDADPPLRVAVEFLHREADVQIS